MISRFITKPNWYNQKSHPFSITLISTLKFNFLIKKMNFSVEINVMLNGRDFWLYQLSFVTNLDIILFHHYQYLCGSYTNMRTRVVSFFDQESNDLKIRCCWYGRSIYETHRVKRMGNTPCSACQGDGWANIINKTKGYCYGIALYQC